MNFDFALIGDTQALTLGNAKRYFQEARKGNNTFIHREWVRDVIKAFASKAELPIPQAKMLIQSGEFRHAQNMHEQLRNNTPSEITILVDNKPQQASNPLWIRYDALTKMLPPDHIAFIRTAYSYAISLRHPNERVPNPKPSEPGMIPVHKKNLRHPDELKSAHIRRTQTALQRFHEIWGNDILTPDQMAKMGDELGLGKV